MLPSLLVSALLATELSEACCRLEYLPQNTCIENPAGLRYDLKSDQISGALPSCMEILTAPFMLSSHVTETMTQQESPRQMHLFCLTSQPSEP